MSEHCCHVDGCMELLCVLDAAYSGPVEDCVHGPGLYDSGKTKVDCAHWKPIPSAEPSKFQKAAALVREALEVAKNAYEEGQGSQSFQWSMASANLAAENIEKALETLEKEA